MTDIPPSDAPLTGWEDFLSRTHPNRLDPDEYRVPGQPVLMTFCSKDREPMLLCDDVREHLIAALPVAARNAGCELMAWCLMPEHLHTLLRVSPDGGDILRFVHSYKTWTGRIISEARLGGWERSFWDRHARDDDDISALISYVMHNPVRRGLCRSPDQWPHSEHCLRIGCGSSERRGR